MQKEARFQGYVRLAVIIVAVVAAIVVPRLLRAYRVDRCLDAGGHWNAASVTCEGVGADSAPTPAT